MTIEYYGANRGTVQRPDALTVGTSSGSTDMELAVDLSKSLTREEVILFLEVVKRYLEDGRFSNPYGV